MRLIEKIEINYLRSLYSASIDKVGDLNVIFGRNDSGKSNLLRALNLFFNDEIDPGRDLEFDLDMSDQRKQEAREAKGKQFIWIKLTFNVPENYRTSLGKTISVKRQWNRDGDMTQTIFPTLDGAGKIARLTRLLNDIDFTYIPAIKDLNVYADLIERMYGAAAETGEIQAATNRFVEAIEGQTTTLSHQLSALFGAPARLAPPTEMSRLFRNLDFAHGEDGHSLLRQKGDGVKARHLPELLRFINASEPRKRFYLWGFEEPENSLDLGAAESEARRFADFSMREDTQVFITSHSPAFYLSNDAEDSRIRRFFITKQQKSENNEMLPKNAADLIDKIEDAEIKMENAGLLQLPFVIRKMNEYGRKLGEKENEAKALKEEIARLSRPTLFVEGIHDVFIFQSALSRVAEGNSINIKPLSGTPKTADALLGALLKQGGISTGTSVLFLFDDDNAGRAAFRNLCKKSSESEPTPYKHNAMAWTLPWTDEFKKFIRKHEIQRDQAFFTSEFLFPISDSASLCLEIVKSRKETQLDEWSNSISGNYWGTLNQKKCIEFLHAKEGSPEWLYARGVPEAIKREFAEECARRNFATTAIDSIAEKVKSSLLRQTNE